MRISNQMRSPAAASSTAAAANTPVGGDRLVRDDLRLNQMTSQCLNAHHQRHGGMAAFSAEDHPSF